MKNYRVPPRELRFTFSRSAGAGGQNVNKLNTKVTLVWDMQNSPTVPKDLAERFRLKFSRYLRDDGTVKVTSQRFRVQSRNIADCLDKLYQLLDQVATPPKKRKATKKPRAAIEKRLREKRQQSEKKRIRKGESV